MDATSTDADLAAAAERDRLFAELDTVAYAADDLRRTLERRSELFLRLSEAGVPKSEIAARVGITKAAVAQAIDRANGVTRKRYEKA